MSIGPKAKWIKNNFSNLKTIFMILLSAIFINFIIVYVFRSYSLLSNLIIISSIFLIFSSLSDVIKSFKNKSFNFSRIISHTAFGFLVLFIGLNYNFSSEKDFNLKLGETEKFENYSKCY